MRHGTTAICIELAQQLDDESMERFERELADAAPGHQVEVVFPAMLELDHRAFARVARALTACAAQVTVRGASRYYERVLAYMGVRTAR